MKSDRLTFYLLVILMECFGIAILIMVSVWSEQYLGGFAWDGSAKEFNYHPVFMIVSMIFLNSQAMIAFRVFGKESKWWVKWLHMIIQAIAFAFGCVGLKAAFDFHAAKGFKQVYTLHSWIGMGSFVLFTCQLVFGFLGFLYPKFPDALRALYLKVHVFFGTAIFLLAVAACLTGLTEKALWTIAAVYGNLPPVALLINFLGVALVLHGGLTYFLTTDDRFKQNDTSEEHQELLDRSAGDAESKH